MEEENVQIETTNNTDEAKENEQEASRGPSVVVQDEVKEIRQKTPDGPSKVVQERVEVGDDNFMKQTAKEKAAWVKMMKSRHASLVKREQDHKKWKDTMIQRRVNVYNRSNKLLNAQRNGFRFLFKMSEVVKHLSENKLKDNEANENETKESETKENEANENETKENETPSNE